MTRHRYSLAAFILMAPVSAALAQPSPGYAFDRPEILASQRAWGIAHGARLLAHACARAGYGAAAEAYVAWQERELPVILAMSRELAGYYFGEEDAAPDRLAAMLGLQLSLSLAQDALEPACATLAEALAQPRYDLSERRAEFLKR